MQTAAGGELAHEMNLMCEQLDAARKKLDEEIAERVLAELRETGGCLALRTRFALAQKAFAHTADYDTAISAYLKGRRFDEIRACYRTE